MISSSQSNAQGIRGIGAVDGVRFHVTVRGVLRQCLVTRDALLFISHTAKEEEEQADLLGIFREYEFRIYRLARMLVTMGIKGTPLLLGPWSFRIDALTYKGRPTPF